MSAAGLALGVIGLRKSFGTVEGAGVHLASPEEARRRGIGTVCQDLAPVGDLALRQNLYLDREPTPGVFPLRILDRRRMIEQTRRMLDRLLVDTPPVRARVRRLSGGQRQPIAIARASSWASALVIMDEPRGEGIARLIVSHDLEPVMRLSHSVRVMRQGRTAAQFRTGAIATRTLIATITGNAADAAAPDAEPVP